jgi:hypothetical protein
MAIATKTLQSELSLASCPAWVVNKLVSSPATFCVSLIQHFLQERIWEIRIVMAQQQHQRQIACKLWKLRRKDTCRACTYKDGMQQRGLRGMICHILLVA